MPSFFYNIVSFNSHINENLFLLLKFIRLLFRTSLNIPRFAGILFFYLFKQSFFTGIMKLEPKLEKSQLKNYCRKLPILYYIVQSGNSLLKAIFLFFIKTLAPVISSGIKFFNQPIGFVSELKGGGFSGYKAYRQAMGT